MNSLNSNAFYSTYIIKYLITPVRYRPVVNVLNACIRHHYLKSTCHLRDVYSNDISITVN